MSSGGRRTKGGWTHVGFLERRCSGEGGRKTDVGNSSGKSGSGTTRGTLIHRDASHKNLEISSTLAQSASKNACKKKNGKDAASFKNLDQGRVRRRTQKSRGPAPVKPRGRGSEAWWKIHTRSLENGTQGSVTSPNTPTPG